MVVDDGYAGLYPKGPDRVPPALTRPSRAYRRHAYLAVAGLIGFVALYFALTGWFAWTTYRLFAAMMTTPDHAVVLAIGGAATGFLAVFMAKALIFIRRGKPGDLELTAADHPRLFAFLHRLADEARAPRPHRVFVSPAVTAGVFYDFSLINLLVSSRKNLVIGLGLVNVLTLGELKAVLAHEFGHFAQQTMAVGRWVYMAQQIAGHVVVKRDALDRMLHALSRSDIRIMWAGWILRLVVWSIRSLVDTAFGGVVLAQRALGREMELQADLVAVSLTGSDALVHALHRLDAADDAMDRALGFASGEHERGKAVADLFAVQTRLLERTRAILGDPSYGVVPALPAAPEGHRLFRAKLAQPPRMWSTHPSNDIREANAKRTYIPAPLDDRSGWLLFDRPDALRARVTAKLYEGRAKGPGDKPLEAPAVEATLAALDAELDKRYLDPRYHGVYLGRSAVRAAGKLAELYGDEPAPDTIAAALDALYPARLAEQVARLRELSEQRTLLRALQRGILEAPGGVVRHRGREHHRRAIPGLLDQLDRELAEVRQALCAHDRQVRTAHVAAARTLSPASEAYLRGVAAILHYADHRNADLQDAAGALQNVLAIALADGRVSSADRDRVLAAADVAYGVLRDVHREAGEVELGALAAKLDAASFKAMLEPLKLNPPRAENLHSWLNAIGSWVADATRALSKLSRTALDELLRAEDDVARRVRAAGAPASAEPAAAEPAPPRPPAHYPVLLPGKERPRQLTLGWWGRFQVADGAVATGARFLVAAAIVGCVVLLGRFTTASTVYLVNGLGRAVVVAIDGKPTGVAAHEHAEIPLAAGDHTIRATTREGMLIEELAVSVEGALDGHYLYNIAGAAALVEWRAQRGGGGSQPLVAAHWQEIRATQLFDAPGDVRSVRNGTAVAVNLAVVRATQVPTDQPGVVAAHARWEPPGARYLATWLQELHGAELASVVRDRLAVNPDDIAALRAEQDGGPHAEVCARHAAQAAEKPSDPGWQYLAVRCIDDRAARNARLDELVARWPKSGWLVFSAAAEALDRDDVAHAVAWLETARAALPELRDAVADRLAVARRLDRRTMVPIGDLADDSDQLRTVAEIEGERRAALAPDLEALRDLYHGEAPRVVSDPSVQLLIAASDGTDDDVVRHALAVPVDQIPAAVAVYGYALARHLGRDGQPYLERFTAQFPDVAAPVTAFLTAASQDPRTAEARLVGLPFEIRGIALAAATVMLGSAAPSGWRDTARFSLLPTQRPYLP